MKLIKAWYEIPFYSRKLDAEENDLGQIRSRYLEDNWGTWRDKNVWGVAIMSLLEITPPTFDYTKPNEEQAQSINALKRWLSENT